MVSNAAMESHLWCDSAATHSYHVGENPDPRTIKAAARRGFAMEDLTARVLAAEDYYIYNLILALDNGHLQWLERRRGKNSPAEIALFLSHAGITHCSEVPDPYYEEAQAFERVLDLVEEGSALLLARIRRELGI